MKQPKYFDKFSVVEAFQITEETRMDSSNWPAWLGRAWNGNRDEIGTIQRRDMKSPLPDQLELVSNEGLIRIQWNDIIVYNGVELEVYSEEKFENTFGKLTHNYGIENFK